MKSEIQILFLVATVIPETLLDAILTPLYPFMIKHMIPGIPEQDVGNYLGLIRPILLLGVGACFFTTLGIGFASQYWQLAMCRFLAGIFGSNSTIAKAMIGDLATDLHTRSWGYAIYGGVFGITGMIGPIIGGIFAPRSSCTEGVFCTFPFLAILLIGSGIVCVAFFLGSFLPTTPPGYTAVEDEVDVESNQSGTYESNTGRIEEGERVIDEGENNIDEDEAMVNTQSNPEPITFDRNTFLILLLYCIIAFVNTNYKVGIPLYFSADEANGGLGYDASYISGSFAFLAGAKLTSQLLLFTPLVKFYQSPIKVYRLGMSLYIPLHLVFPFMVYALNSRSILVICTMISLGLCESISYLSIILLITESQKRHLGLVHGISTTMTALVYIISPAIAGGLWKVGVLYHIPWIDFIFGSFLSFLAVVLSFFIKD